MNQTTTRTEFTVGGCKSIFEAVLELLQESFYPGQERWLVWDLSTQKSDPSQTKITLFFSTFPPVAKYIIPKKILQHYFRVQ